jgi:outer membrane protein OmpA-like peptidoglycan-associated protein
MNKKIFTILLLSIIALMSVFPGGPASYADLRSPLLLGGAPLITRTDFPHLTRVNPATAAGNQRLTFDLNYLGTSFDTSISGWKGHIINAGASLPTKVGVFSSTFNFLTTPAYESLDLGTQIDFGVVFSKELYPGFYSGAGLVLSAGSGLAAFADLGVLHFLGDLGSLKNFRWALALQGLGYGNKTKTSSPLYSVTGGAAFTPLTTRDIKIDLGADIQIPTYENLRIAIGTDVVFRDTLNLRVASRVDFAELINGNPQGLIPSLSLSYTYRPKELSSGTGASSDSRVWQRGEITTSAGAAPMGNGLWAMGGGINFALGSIDKNPPEIEIEMSGFRFWKNDTGSEDSIDIQDQPIENTSEPEKSVKDNTANSGDINNTGKGSKDGKIVSVLPGTKPGQPKTARDLNTSYVQNGQGDPDKGLIKNSSEFDAVPVVEYISPNNDGIFDALEFPLSIKDSRYLEGFAMVVQDRDGQVVRRIQNKDERPENTGFLGFFSRIFSKKEGISIPSSLRWDGTSEEGVVVSDEKYVFFIQAWDDNGNVGSSQPLGVIVDTVPPRISMDPPRDLDLIFSPDGDGNKDKLTIGLSGSKEDLWKLQVNQSDGTTVRTYQWQDSSPESIQWEGLNDANQPVPDGVYRVSINSTDRAGNSVKEGFDNIIINTVPTPVGIDISSSYLNPENREAINQLEFSFSIPVTQGILRWTLTIRNSTGRSVKIFETSGTPPSSLVYRGLTDSGDFLAEGDYTARLSVVYSNGSKPEATSALFTVDRTPPTAEVRLDYLSFSPNGDDNKDFLRILQESSNEQEWQGVITTPTGDVIKSFQWLKNAESRLDWDGYTDGGKLADDGIYTYRLFTRDQAGNQGSSKPVQFTLDTEETPVILSSSHQVFSPNGDGILDELILSPQLRVADGVARFSIALESERGEIVKEFSGNGNPRQEYLWDGFSTDGRPLPDGRYRGKLRVVYEKGDISEAYSRYFTIDTQYPRITIESPYTLFSPDNDGLKDGFRVSQKGSEEEQWTGTISNQRGETIREYQWKGLPVDFSWDGTDGSGNRVPDGSYSYRISAVDKGGNSTEQVIEDITVDTASTPLFITSSADGFSPNGSGRHEDISFDILIPNKEGVTSWKMTIASTAGQQVRSYTDSKLPVRIIWDGTDGEGNIVSDGTYIAKIELEYLKGNKPRSETPPFVLDTRAPELNISMTPKPFSPDNDGVDDELNIFLNAEDQTSVKSWELSIFDRNGKKFKTYTGLSNPSELILWDGRGDNGELVVSAEDYTYQFKALDKWDNQAATEGILPVDVLVVKDGNKLKIQIASIQFAPDSPMLSEASPEIIERNRYVLLRLSEILKKYGSYRITIEGHAASLFWNNPERAQKEEVEELQPLSLQRAETVKEYLIRLGIKGERINTLGMGGRNPVVPHSVTDERWRNRRVEFILEK